MLGRGGLLALLLLGTACEAHAGFDWFLPVQISGGHTVRPQGIDLNGRVVGSYLSNDDAEHGFIWFGGPSATIDAPLATRTVVTDINDLGKFVGSFDLGGREWGYIFDKGTYQPLLAPNALNILPYGLNNSEILVGAYQYLDGPDTVTAGFILDRGVYELFEMPLPDVVRTVAMDISDFDEVVGWYDTRTSSGAEEHHGFLLSGSTIILIDAPGAIGTVVDGINNLGLAVGTCLDVFGRAHGFLWDEDLYYDLDVPGALETFITGINDFNVVTGYYIDDQGIHGFIGQPDYTPLSLPTNPSAVAPEPATLLPALLAAGFLPIGLARRRRSRRQAA